MAQNGKGNLFFVFSPSQCKKEHGDAKGWGAKHARYDIQCCSSNGNPSQRVGQS